MKKHAQGEPHKKAFDLNLQDKGLTVHERLETMHQNVRGIACYFDVMKQKDFELTKKKFEAAYFVVQEELPITSSQRFWKLKKSMMLHWLRHTGTIYWVK